MPFTCKVSAKSCHYFSTLLSSASHAELLVHSAVRVAHSAGLAYFVLSETYPRQALVNFCARACSRAVPELHVFCKDFNSVLRPLRETDANTACALYKGIGKQE